ncbi:methionine aminopeptidase [Streptomyces sp. 3330]|nr:methionine aminopeptidase [Streptomyces sp. 3330]
MDDAIAHGIPAGYRLRDSAPLPAGFGATPDGWAGDAAISCTAGAPRPADVRPAETAERARAPPGPPGGRGLQDMPRPADRAIVV